MKFTFNTKDGKKYTCELPDDSVLRSPITSALMATDALRGQTEDKILNDQAARIEAMLTSHLAGKKDLVWKNHPVEFVEVKESVPVAVPAKVG